jgi:hypothetical protein
MIDVPFASHALFDARPYKKAKQPQTTKQPRLLQTGNKK